MGRRRLSPCRSARRLLPPGEQAILALSFFLLLSAAAGGTQWKLISTKEQLMIKPYTAVGLIPTVRGIRTRADIKINLEHLSHLVKAAAWLSSLDLPVRLIAFPEGALQAF